MPTCQHGGGEPDEDADPDYEGQPRRRTAATSTAPGRTPRIAAAVSIRYRRQSTSRRTTPKISAAEQMLQMLTSSTPMRGRGAA
ncbi:hypothetical protein [Rhodococcus wratislaviensis]|uniref:hypothetical protein n=1 Tax=Rhodococcus wratislaviensis TaxID=44752 RepID=UPI00365EF615